MAEERGSKRPSPYRRELAIEEDRPATPSQDSPGLSGPIAHVSLQATASPAAHGSTTGSSHRLLPKSRLGFNDPFAQTATVDYPPAACTRHASRRGLPLQESESEDSSDAEDGEDADREGSALADEQHLVLERADDTLQRLLREGVWSEPELPAAQATSQAAASQLLGASWRLPGQVSAGTSVALEPAQWLAPPPDPRAAAPSRAGRKRPTEAEAEAEAEAEVPRLPPSLQPRAWPLVAWRAPRAAAAAAGVLRAELRVFVGTWNMHGKPPPPSLSPWLPPQPALSHDLLVIGTQDSMVKGPPDWCHSSLPWPPRG